MAMPAEGPSFGIAPAGTWMCASMAPSMRSAGMPSEVAMTGEITLRGRVLPIGGLKEKVLGAHRAGITAVIIPKENEADLEDVPEEVRKQLTFHPVETLADVLKTALVSDATANGEGRPREEMAATAA